MGNLSVFFATLLFSGSVLSFEFQKNEENCPCIERAMCPRAYGEGLLDAKELGEMRPCEEEDSVRCCGVSVSVAIEKVELFKTHPPLGLVFPQENNSDMETSESRNREQFAQVVKPDGSSSVPNRRLVFPRGSRKPSTTPTDIITPEPTPIPSSTLATPPRAPGVRRQLLRKPIESTVVKPYTKIQTEITTEKSATTPATVITTEAVKEGGVKVPKLTPFVPKIRPFRINRKPATFADKEGGRDQVPESSEEHFDEEFYESERFEEEEEEPITPAPPLLRKRLLRKRPTSLLKRPQQEEKETDVMADTLLKSVRVRPLDRVLGPRYSPSTSTTTEKVPTVVFEQVTTPVSMPERRRPFRRVIKRIKPAILEKQEEETTTSTTPAPTTTTPTTTTSTTTTEKLKPIYSTELPPLPSRVNKNNKNFYTTIQRTRSTTTTPEPDETPNVQVYSTYSKRRGSQSATPPPPPANNKEASQRFTIPSKFTFNFDFEPVLNSTKITTTTTTPNPFSQRFQLPLKPFQRQPLDHSETISVKGSYPDEEESYDLVLNSQNRNKQPEKEEEEEEEYEEEEEEEINENKNNFSPPDNPALQSFVDFDEMGREETKQKSPYKSSYSTSDWIPLPNNSPYSSSSYDDWDESRIKEQKVEQPQRRIKMKLKEIVKEEEDAYYEKPQEYVTPIPTTTSTTSLPVETSTNIVRKLRPSRYRAKLSTTLGTSTTTEKYADSSASSNKFRFPPYRKSQASLLTTTTAATTTTEVPTTTTAAPVTEKVVPEVKVVEHKEVEPATPPRKEVVEYIQEVVQERHPQRHEYAPQQQRHEIHHQVPPQRHEYVHPHPVPHQIRFNEESHIQPQQIVPQRQEYYAPPQQVRHEYVQHPYQVVPQRQEYLHPVQIVPYPPQQEYAPQRPQQQQYVQEYAPPTQQEVTLHREQYQNSHPHHGQNQQQQPQRQEQIPMRHEVVNITFSHPIPPPSNEYKHEHHAVNSAPPQRYPAPNHNENDNHSRFQTNSLFNGNQFQIHSPNPPSTTTESIRYYAQPQQVTTPIPTTTTSTEVYQPQQNFNSFKSSTENLQSSESSTSHRFKVPAKFNFTKISTKSPSADHVRFPEENHDTQVEPQRKLQRPHHLDLNHFEHHQKKKFEHQNYVNNKNNPIVLKTPGQAFLHQQEQQQHHAYNQLSLPHPQQQEPVIHTTESPTEYAQPTRQEIVSPVRQEYVSPKQEYDAPNPQNYVTHPQQQQYIQPQLIQTTEPPLVTVQMEAHPQQPQPQRYEYSPAPARQEYVAPQRQEVPLRQEYASQQNYMSPIKLQYVQPHQVKQHYNAPERHEYTSTWQEIPQPIKQEVNIPSQNASPVRNQYVQPAQAIAPHVKHEYSSPPRQEYKTQQEISEPNIQANVTPQKEIAQPIRQEINAQPQRQENVHQHQQHALQSFKTQQEAERPNFQQHFSQNEQHNQRFQSHQNQKPSSPTPVPTSTVAPSKFLIENGQLKQDSRFQVENSTNSQNQHFQSQQQIQAAQKQNFELFNQHKNRQHVSQSTNKQNSHPVKNSQNFGPQGTGAIHSQKFKKEPFSTEQQSSGQFNQTKQHLSQNHAISQHSQGAHSTQQNSNHVQNAAFNQTQNHHVAQNLQNSKQNSNQFSSNIHNPVAPQPSHLTNQRPSQNSQQNFAFSKNQTRNNHVSQNLHNSQNANQFSSNMQQHPVAAPQPLKVSVNIPNFSGNVFNQQQHPSQSFQKTSQQHNQQQQNFGPQQNFQQQRFHNFQQSQRQGRSATFEEEEEKTLVKEEQNVPKPKQKKKLFQAPKSIQRGFYPVLPYSEEDPGPVLVQKISPPKTEKFLELDIKINGFKKHPNAV